MSINIGTEAVNAVIEMRNNPQFDRLVTALGVVTQTRMLGAMGSPVETRTDATAYARGMYDLWEALHAAYNNVAISLVKPPALGKRVKEDANV